MSMLEKLGKVERRWIYLIIALAVIIPLVFKVVFPVITTPIVQNAFDQVEMLPPGSKLLLTADYGPSTIPENQPMMEAVLRHASHKDLKVYMVSLWATGPPMIDMAKRNVLQVDFASAIDGEDWIDLGFKAGNQGVINSAFSDFKTAFPVDVNGKDVREIPMMADIEKLEDFDLIVAIGSGFPGVKEWIQFGGDPARVPIVGGVTAVEAPLLYPYYPRQLAGLLGGLLGAAEYEAALVKAYPQFEATSTQAIQRMGPQTVAHLAIIAFIVLGNIAYLAGGREKPRIGATQK